MRLIKFKYILPAAAMVLSLGMGACVNDLDVTPIDPSTNMTPNYDALFNKCYANFAMAGQGGADGDCDIDGLDGGMTGFVRQMFNANELTTDEAICCWGDEGIPAFNFNQWGASHPMLKGFYYRLYFGVTMCNFFLNEVPADYDATRVAEVRFIRALHYYYLMDTFGNVPFLTTMSTENAPQASRAQVYQFVEDELLAIEPLLMDARTNTYGRVDKAAVWMLLSRLYLNAEVYTGTAQWQKAANYAEKVMKSGYTLFDKGNSQWSAYQMLFMGDNGENGAQCEAIFPLIQDGITTTSYGTSLFLMASTFSNDMTIVGDATNNTDQAWAGNRARPELVKKFFPNDVPQGKTAAEMVKAAGDDRALLWSKDRELDIDDVAVFTQGFSIAKFVNFYSNGQAAKHKKFCDTDFFLMRAAEAWLTYAEASARANGGTLTAKGVDAINALRTRANADTKSVYTLDEVLDEWCREFYFEGRRRIDLVRFGKFGGSTDYKWQWKGGLKEGTNFSSNLNIFPIPDTDLAANPNLKQNPGY